MEIASDENAAIVARIYDVAMEALREGRAVSPEQRLIHDVEHMMQEANSGASFEQYFRWAPVREIATVVESLSSLDLDEVAGIVTRAIDIAFPEGIPGSDEEKGELTDWTEEQEEELASLFEELEEHNGAVMNKLGEFATRVGV